MKFIKIIGIILLLVAGSVDTGVYAQSGQPFDVLKDDITQVLPPLNTLLDSAVVNDPQMKFTLIQERINKGNLRTQQTFWTQDIGVQANIGYGTFDYVYNNSQGTSVPASYVSRQSQTQYNVGGFFRLPLYDVVNHRNQVKIMRDQVEQARSLADGQANLVRQNVIKQYYTMVSMQRQMKIKSKYLETSRINMQLAEKSFMNGTITIDEYSRVSEIESRTEAEFESTKADFLSAYQTLEVMVGMKFNLNNINR